MTHCFSIEGELISKGRPRTGNGGRWYTPTQRQEKVLAKQIWARMVQCGMKTIEEGPVRIKLTFCGASKSKDIDNLIKHFLDAANGILWNDDRQVEEIFARKIDGEARISVEVGKLV